MAETAFHPRWYQYSLRTLLLFVLVCSVPCSWFATKMQQAKRQKEAVAAINELRGRVWYDYQTGHMDQDDEMQYVGEPTASPWLRERLGDDFFGNVIGAEFDRTTVTDEWLSHLQNVPRLRVLSLHDTRITDAGLEHVQRLRQLEMLDLSGTQVTEAGIAILKSLHSLQGLILSDTRITDVGLNDIGELHGLQTLYLQQTGITDAGLRHLERLPHLQQLGLGFTNITDAGLQHLGGLSELRWISLVGTRVSDAGKKTLQRKLPNCRIQ